MSDFIFSLTFRRFFVREESVRIRTIQVPMQRHSFVSDDWAIGVTDGLRLHLLIVGQRDGPRMKLVRNVPLAGSVPAHTWSGADPVLLENVRFLAAIAVQPTGRGRAAGSGLW
jgi:hypothetical protein